MVAEIAAHALNHKFPDQIISEFVKDVVVAYKTDGIVIFQIIWKTNAPHSRSVEYNIASITSHL